MMKRCQQVRFTFEVLHDGFTHERVRCGIDHFLDCDELGYIWEMHIAGAINRSHTPNANHFLNRIAIGKQSACLKLTWRAGIIIASIIRQFRKYTGFQCYSPLFDKL